MDMLISLDSGDLFIMQTYTQTSHSIPYVYIISVNFTSMKLGENTVCKRNQKHPRGLSLVAQ